MSERHYQVEVFFDGGCPLCAREIALLRRLDGSAGRIRFTDIQSAEFASANVGLSRATLMRRIHGRLPTGELIEGVEVFRRLYSAVGFQRAVSVSRWPGVAELLAVGYELFAKHRLRLTGRCEGDLCALPERSSSSVSSARASS